LCKESNDRGDDRGDSILDERHFSSRHVKGAWETAGFSQKEQVSHQNKGMQLHNVGGGPQGQDKLTRSSWNAQFYKEGDRQMAEFREKLTRHQPVTSFKVD
jgi:hypothetical protein